MGWIKTATTSTREIFEKVKKEFGSVWNGRIGNSACPYEYFADHLRDNYDLTLRQCDDVCRMIKNYYKIERFYYSDYNRPY